MLREIGVQSQVGSYQRLKKWYLMPPCLKPSIIKYVSRVKWSNPGEEVAPSPTPRCCSYWKESLQVTLDYGCQLYFIMKILDNFLWMLINLIKEYGFTQKMTRNRWYPAETITDADYTDDLVLLASTSAIAKSLLHSLEQAAREISLYVNSDKIQFICYKQEGAISTLNGKPLK